MSKKTNDCEVQSSASTWKPEDGLENLVVANNAELNTLLEREDVREAFARECSKKSDHDCATNPTSIEWTKDLEKDLPMTNAQLNTLIEEQERQKSQPSTNKSINAPASSKLVSKKVGNKNALRHGVYSNGLFPWESEEEFRVLNEEFREYWKPHGAVEEQAVLILAQWTWKRRRVEQASQISFFRSPVPDQLKSGEATWEDVVQYQAEVPEKVETLISEQIKLAENLNSASARIANHHYWTHTQEGKDIQSAVYTMKSDVARLASDVREKMGGGSKDIGRTIEKIMNLFDQAYQLDEMEKHNKSLSMIDKEIDKSVKRIIYLKTFKTIEATQEPLDVRSRPEPLLESPPVTPNQSATLEDVKASEEGPLRGSPTNPVALAAPEHRGLPKPD